MTDFTNRKSTRRTFLKAGGTGLLLAVAGGLASPAIAKSKEIRIISDLSNAQQIVILGNICKEFEKKTGTKISLNNMDHEANKTAIRNYLVADAPDICFWFSGERMRAFVKRGLFADISDLFQREHYKKALGAAADAVTVNGKQYGLPLDGILWGFYYRQDVFDKHGLTPPKSLDDLYALSKKAKAAGLIPVSMGTKELWPAAGWFDHLDLRINGLDSHMALMNGKMSYLDPALDKVFDHWEEMIKQDIFLKNGTSYTWQQAGAFLAQKKAALMDLGNFIEGVMPKDELDQLRFIRFPTIGKEIGPFEDFSVNSIHVPEHSSNKEGAKDFLAYFYQPDRLASFLDPVGSVPPRNDMPKSKDPLVEKNVEDLKATKGTAQYYDRDTDPEMAQAGLKGFQEFTVYPERRKQILTQLERTRERIYGKI